MAEEVTVGEEVEAKIADQPPSLGGPKKAAVMMITLGADACAQIFKSLDEEDVELLTAEIARLEGVTSELREKVLEEFHQLAVAQRYILQGGVDYAKTALEAAMGPRKAREILEKVQSTIRTTGFSLLKDIDPMQVVNFIQKEHPQTVALLLAHMEPTAAAPILSALPQELQVDVTTRMATMQSVSPDVLEQVEEVLSQQMKSLFGGNVSEVGGVKFVAEMLNQVDRGAEKNILGNLERENPELATEIKNLMFVFEDIGLLDDRGIQRVLKEIDTKDLGLALKGASESVSDKFFRNMSSRAAEMMKEDMQFMGPVRLKDVEGAQQRIVDVVRRLEDEGEIVISGRGGDDEIVV
jgi:flagellar motor switch protein FliG